jgi:hypothetical protein
VNLQLPSGSGVPIGIKYSRQKKMKKKIVENKNANFRNTNKTWFYTLQERID